MDPAIPEILVTITIITVIVRIIPATIGFTDTGIRTSDIPWESGTAECYPIGATHRIRILSWVFTDLRTRKVLLAQLDILPPPKSTPTAASISNRPVSKLPPRPRPHFSRKIWFIDNRQPTTDPLITAVSIDSPARSALTSAIASFPCA